MIFSWSKLHRRILVWEGEHHAIVGKMKMFRHSIESLHYCGVLPWPTCFLLNAVDILTFGVIHRMKILHILRGYLFLFLWRVALPLHTHTAVELLDHVFKKLRFRTCVMAWSYRVNSRCVAVDLVIPNIRHFRKASAVLVLYVALVIFLLSCLLYSTGTSAAVGFGMWKKVLAQASRHQWRRPSCSHCHLLFRFDYGCTTQNNWS